MRTLRLSTTGCLLPAHLSTNPRLFDDVYTKVKSQIKRALTEEQMGRLMHADLDVLSEELQRVQAYFLLMFLFRGMPFIDLAHLAQAGRERWQNSVSPPQDGQTDYVAYPPGSIALTERV